jgi:hypothetical protein
MLASDQRHSFGCQCQLVNKLWYTLEGAKDVFRMLRGSATPLSTQLAVTVDDEPVTIPPGVEGQRSYSVILKSDVSALDNSTIMIKTENTE